MMGVGYFNMHLRSNQGHSDKVDIPQAVFVTSSPYNLIPPQLLASTLKAQGYEMKRFDHDDHNYNFHYRRNGQTKWRTMTVLKNQNGLFLFQTKCGFKKFFKAAGNYADDRCFCGIGEASPPTLVEDSDSKSTDSSIRPKKLRERTLSPMTMETRGSPISLETRESVSREVATPNIIPASDADFAPGPSNHNGVDFSVPPTHHLTFTLLIRLRLLRIKNGNG
mmetsp:Transcript_27265/g.38567  ORF Transcript_27265/g.38567 Transcript_27265/m.38567 type:complete len:222 (-) Transcript_27265:67-732(-)